jgi:hypothetical protein
MSRTLDTLWSNGDRAESSDVGQKLLHGHENGLKNRRLAFQRPSLDGSGRFVNTGHFPRSNSWSDVVNVLTNRAWDMISETTSKPS